jgi:protein-disulfide isomerase
MVRTPVAVVLAGLVAGAASWPLPARAEPRARGRQATVWHEPPAATPGLGPRHAPVTIEAFLDLHDGRRSAGLHAQLLTLRELHPRRLRVALHFTGTGALNHAAYEAAAQGDVAAFLREAFASGHPQRDELAGYAVRAGLSAARIEAAAAALAHGDAITRAQALATRRGVRTRPALVVSGHVPERQPVSIDELEAAYDEAYARARALLDRGVPVAEIWPRLLADSAPAEPLPPWSPGPVDDRPDVEPPSPLPAPAPVASAPVPDSLTALARGASDARVTLVLLGSFQSQPTATLYRGLLEIEQVYADDVRVIFAPLFDDETQPDARLAHEAALCAADQGRFWDLAHDLLLAKRRRELAPSYLEESAQRLGLDGEVFARCLSSRRQQAAVQAGLDWAGAAGITHAPALIAQGRVYLGVRTRADLAWLVADLLRSGWLDRIERIFPANPAR